ncbi:hypothetical protein [Klebsiella phage BUCT_49532]|uniref:hypothetical protein n=1 Tax=Klebsiella phage BUCT_49532 TaxID=2849971 RepID=UPI001C787AA9|nr:hypothetical protein PQZ56_gp10 [Klebsiella phage BUCT_49532]WCI99713.1 hypothetical protein [Klebsiella phage BUCT_49532]
MRLCSVCAPVKYRDGNSTDFGEWHGVFPRIYLPKGKFKTDEQGNLEHVETGDKDYMNYQIYPEDV